MSWSARRSSDSLAAVGWCTAAGCTQFSLRLPSSQDSVHVPSGGHDTKVAGSVLLVIVGAGASYGCRPSFSGTAEGDSTLGIPQASDGWRPPLTVELFEERDTFATILQSYPAARGLVGRLRRELTGDSPLPIEHLIASASDEARASPARRRELLALQLYLQELLLRVGVWVRNVRGAVTFYDELVSLVDEACHAAEVDVAYVSFNYDTLLDEAVSGVHGLPITDLSGVTELDTYLRGDRVQVIKPHGSVNWWQAHEHQTGALRRNELMPVAPDLKAQSRYRVRRERPRLVRAANDSFWLPVLALPRTDKQEFAAPPEHISRMDDLEDRISSLLVIGWRGLEPHFLPYLRKTLTSEAFITICGMDEASCGEVGDHLRRELNLPYHPTHVTRGFEGLVSKSPGQPSRLESWLDQRLQPRSA